LPAAALPWLERWQSDGTWRVVAGSQFRIALSHQINSRDASPGQPVTARLLKNLELGGNLIAPAESTVKGSITQVTSARNKLMANLSMKRWGQDDGMIRVEFREIVCPDGKRVAIKASPAPLTMVEDLLKDRGSVRVTQKGFITFAPQGGAKYKVAHRAVAAASTAAGPVGSLVARPVANAVLSAASPSYAERRPVDRQERSSLTRRLTLGLAEGVPGGSLVTDAFRKGDNVVVDIEQPIVLELKEDLILVPPVALGPEIAP
jgi:hypothetical protein